MTAKKQKFVQYSTLKTGLKNTGQTAIDSLFDKMDSILGRYKRTFKQQSHLTPKDKRNHYKALFKNASALTKKLENKVFKQDRPFCKKALEETVSLLDKATEKGKAHKQSLISLDMLELFNDRLADHVKTSDKKRPQLS